jgi:hypothetical protein
MVLSCGASIAPAKKYQAHDVLFSIRFVDAERH